MARGCMPYGLCRISLYLLGLLLAGCIHLPAEPGYAGPKVLPETTRESYAYRKYPGPYLEEVLQQNADYTFKRISFPSRHNILPLPHDIRIDYYAIDAEGRVPVVLILPIFGGGKDIIAGFADYFARHGFAAAIVHRQKEYKKPENLLRINEVMRQTVFDQKQAIDWIETRPELDATKIAVFGISMGGIKGALISALDERVAATVIALGAGDIPYILAHTSEKGVKKRRKILLAQESLSLAEFERQLTEKMECDPLNYAEYIDARRTLMVLALFDRVVFYRKGVELKEKIGNPETIYLFSGHYSAILYRYYVRYQARKFLERQLR